ncbi:MAG: UDP-glucose 4-epimerase GalE [Candidatus Calescibacterium sp.]|nr:UDP-glucose 4-epimerase GalE [Candidatus Calescibacterium sp.]
MKILITGGAGYIGSCTTLKIVQKYNAKCIIIDKQETSNLEKLKLSYPKNIEFYKIDMCSYTDFKELFEHLKTNTFRIDAVIHFAAYTIVSESEKEIHKYLYNNTVSTLNLLDLMNKYDINNLIFSSSASVYGQAKYIPIDENHPLNPQSSYALSKKISEDIIHKYSQKGLNFINLRYFNPAGAIGYLGEEHNPETHLIPLLIKSLIEGKIFKIFGNDFPTPDGTCIRDFIHIEDLVESHLLCMEKLLTEEIENEIFNIGINKGYSVLEVVNKSIETFNSKIHPKFKYTIDNRREGDVPILVAQAEKIKNKLGFQPKYKLEDILLSVWNYEIQKISL